MASGDELDEEPKGTPKETFGLHVLYDPRNGQPDAPVFADVVAVHGLGGDSFSTWTDGSSNILWLRDLLPKSSYFANCRIFTFGYDAKKWLTPLEPSKGRVFTFAEDLLTALRSKRILTGSIGRPIAFIGHSLGGIVIKKALVIAHLRPLLYGDIDDSTKSITFFGTPHQGSKTAAWATYLGSISKVVGVRNSAATSDLKTWSPSLLDLSREFCEQITRLQLTSFYETEKYKGIIVVDEGSAFIGHHKETVRALRGNHRTICKFASADLDAYRTVLEQLEVTMHEMGNAPKRVTVPNQTDVNASAPTRAGTLIEDFEKMGFPNVPKSRSEGPPKDTNKKECSVPSERDRDNIQQLERRWTNLKF